MKKVLCMSFLLFATTLCFAAPLGTADKPSQSFTLPTITSDIPYACYGSRYPPPCPGEKQ